MKIDLGCGENKKEDFIGMDISPLPRVDYVVDLAKEPLPFQDNTVDEVYTKSFLEHLEIEGIIHVMEEVWRVSRNGARVELNVPHFSSCYAADEFHKTFFRCRSFGQLLGGQYLKTSRQFEYPCQYRIIRRRITFEKIPFLFWNYLVEPIVNLSWKITLFWEHSFLVNLFPGLKLILELEVVKQRAINTHRK